MTSKLNILVQSLAELQDSLGNQEKFGQFLDQFGMKYPRVIAIGNQSSGKSSILESIVGKTFLPCGPDMVTKCPLFVRLRQTKDQEMAVFAAEEKYGIERKEIFNFSLMEQEIIRRTEKRVGITRNISHEPIHIDIYSLRFPDLQFVDLPGFTKTPVVGQNEDIEEQILELNLKYMKDENTVILAIHDATQDIGVCEALKQALHHDIDPEGKRTIGVLTKLDLLQTATDLRRVENIMKNETKPLKLGYVGVINNKRETSLGLHNKEDKEQKKINDPISFWKNEDVKLKIGIEHLRQFITSTLANKLSLVMPAWKQQLLRDQLTVVRELKELGCGEDNIEYEDLISKFVEQSVEKMKIYIQGMDVGVETRKISTGASINKTIKEGVKKASKEARESHSVFEFIGILKMSIRNTHGIRDHVLPTELVLEIAVSLLTENYRDKFQELLTHTADMLVEDLRSALAETLQIYPQFQDLVTDILLGEMSKNKLDAENCLNMMIDMHKRTINSHHPDLRDEKQKCDDKTWFKESIPTRKQCIVRTPNGHYSSTEGMELSLQSDHWVNENVPTAFQTPGTIHLPEKKSNPQFPVTKTENLSNLTGFSKRVQIENNPIPTRQFPTELEDEAKFHLDIALEYMQIIDKQLVDEVLKVLVLMLIHKTLDFLKGGNHYRTSLLREVLKKCREEGVKENILSRSESQEDLINQLREKKVKCDNIIKVIDGTQILLSKCK